MVHSSSQPVFVGIDTSGNRLPITYALLDLQGQLLSIDAGDIEFVANIVSGIAYSYVAVNSSAGVNRGLVKRLLGSESAGHLHGADLRIAENDLRRRGIHVSPTPSRESFCPPWIQIGFAFYRKLDGLGYKFYPSPGVARQVLETNPHAAFCALLGSLPLQKTSLEGRIQRQLILFEEHLTIKDPMEFFEEITRHKILNGILPLDCLYSSDELDAIIAAYTALKAFTHPDEIISVGEKEEGEIYLPVAELKSIYL